MSRVSPYNWSNLDSSEESIERDAHYAVGLVQSYKDWISHTGDTIVGKDILELGPGTSFAGALGLLGGGARSATVADRWLSPWREAYHRPLYKRVSQLLGANQLLGEARVFADASEYGHASLIKEIASPTEELAASGETFDLVYSNAVLEHLFDHERAIQSLASITRKGGWNLHQVDYRDHADNDRPLEHLLMTRSEFTALDLEEPCSRGCQIRAKEHLELFVCAGFEHTYTYLSPAPSAEYLDDFMRRLSCSSSQYRSWQVDDLGIVGAMLIFRRL